MSKLRCLWDALKIAWLQTPFRVWVAICSVGIIIGILVGIKLTDLVLLISIAFVGLGLEVANTSIETLMDIVHPSYSKKVKIVKDCFAVVPIFAYSAYVVSWLLLVAPIIYEKVVG